MDFDDRLERLGAGPMLGLLAVGVLVPLAGVLAAPLVGDVLLVAVSAIFAIVGATGWRRRTQLLAMPLEIAPVVMRGPHDGQLRVQIWLGRGRPMRDVSLTATVGGTQARAGAAGPVVGPWTAVLDLPEGDVEVEATCQSGGRSWTARRMVRQVQSGVFAPSVVGSVGKLKWDRTAWGAPRPEVVPPAV